MRFSFLLAISVVTVTGMSGPDVSLAGPPSPAQTACRECDRVVGGVLRLLPDRPQAVVVIDADRAAPALRQATAVWVIIGGTQVNSDLAPALRFHCHEGFSVGKCEEELARLRDVLANFDLRPLGEWTWVLVRSEDWKPILRQVGRDPDSPAFTILAARQTFLEEALFDPDPLRSRTLLERFRMPLEKLLPFAVAHELAHALCGEADERRTDWYATQLRQTGSTSCREQHGAAPDHIQVMHP